MNRSHSLETLNGMNPNTARKLFTRLEEQWNGVSWGDFYRFHGGSRLACFKKGSRWIPGDLFRKYFAERGTTCGRAFVRLYSEKSHRPSENAYETSEKTEGTPKRNGNGTRNAKSIASEIAMLKAEVKLYDALIERRKTLDALRNAA